MHGTALRSSRLHQQPSGCVGQLGQQFRNRYWACCLVLKGPSAMRARFFENLDAVSGSSRAQLASLGL